ncbi:MAG: EF-hand domain-containing protein [Verrucomicrobiota bacterium]
MKKVLSTVGLCSALFVGFAFVATAGEKGAGSDKDGKRGGAGAGGQRPDPAEMFGKMDADGSGGISLEEFKNNPRAKNAPDPSKVDARFNHLDADGSGEVSQEEFAAAMKKMAGRGGKGGAGGGKGGKGGERPTE